MAWSLEVEIQFYVLVPLLARLFAIRRESVRRITIASVMLAVMGLQAAVGPATAEWLRLTVLGQLQFFLCGFLLADLYLTTWRSEPAATGGWRWDLVSLVGWPLLVALWEHPAATRWAFPWLALALYAATFRGRWSGRVFSNPWVTTIGGMCYTIYLLHYPIISFVGRHTAAVRPSAVLDLNLLWQLLLITPPVLLVCAVYFALIERPCMRPDWPQRLVARIRTWTPARSTA